MIEYYAIPKIVHNEMNMDHSEEVNRLNHIESLLDSDASETELSEALESYFEFTRMHSAKEEKIMREAGYPGYEQHMHAELKHAIVNWHATKQIDRLRDLICNDIPKWLYKHIGSMDTAAATYIIAAKAKSA